MQWVSAENLNLGLIGPVMEPMVLVRELRDSGRPLQRCAAGQTVDQGNSRFEGKRLLPILALLHCRHDPRLTSFDDAPRPCAGRRPLA
jgi:hypothetical protein